MAGAVSSHLHLSIMFCLYFVVFLSICVPHATSLSFSFDFSKPGAYCGEKLNCTGDAYFSSRTIELTRNDRTEGSSNSSGRVWYAQPVQLWENVTGELASFDTNFSFVIKPDSESFNPDGTANTGDGMAFFLGHYPSAVPVDSTGGNIGLFRGGDNMNATGNDRIVAVEFDTYWNRGWDRSGSHVGVDVNSIVSVAYANTTLPGKELTSGSVMTARINYDNSTEMLSVHLLIGSAIYYVNTSVDLRRCLPEEVAVGFSAATGKSAEIHRILSWSFASTLNKSKTKTMAPVETPASVSSRPPASVQKAIIPSSAALFVLVCAVAGFLLWRRRTGKKVKETSENESDHEHDEAAEFESVVGPRRYRYCELAAVTSNFAEEEKLGQGGFGHVYRGCLRDQDRPVAIKVFSEESSRQGRKEFEAEVKIISRLRHRNLVQLLGWCDSRKGLLLVYELAPGGSLDKHIYSNGRVLTWPERYKIILGLGSALCYLHVEWEQRIVHGDIKPSNILLDSLFNTKLGDFGLARLIDHGSGPRTTKVVAGTAGYIDPEFINTCRPSTESDVYSFGIVLLEIVSGRQPVQEQSDGFFVLLKWVWDLYSKNAVLDAVDERLRGELCDAQRQMERALAVGLWCAHPDRSTRPSIAQAMHVLQSMDVQLPVIPSQMYMTAPYLALDEGALSVRTSSGVHSTTSGDTIRSSDTLTSLGISEIPD